MKIEAFLWFQLGVLLSALRWYLLTQNRAYLYGFVGFLFFEALCALGGLYLRDSSRVPPTAGSEFPGLARG